MHGIEALVKASLSGDRKAFGKLYDLFSKKIYRFHYYRCYHRETAEDLTSQTFLKALERLSTFRPERGPFSAWIYGIARNCLMDHFRQKTNSVELEDIWEMPSSVNLELDAENKDNWKKIQPFLKQLSSDERNIVLLRIWDELSYREIAQIVNKTEGSCKMAFSRALSFLREALPLPLFIWLLFFKERML
jgi:RNA polymerase sigma-70 factor (ECF subfamily)